MCSRERSLSTAQRRLVTGILFYPVRAVLRHLCMLVQEGTSAGGSESVTVHLCLGDPGTYTPGHQGTLTSRLRKANRLLVEGRHGKGGGGGSYATLNAPELECC
jgi:hypothetical protein